MSALDRCASYEDYRRLAKRRLPRVLFDYIDGGSYSETTLRRNAQALADTVIAQRVAVDATHLDLAVDVFGTRWAVPIALAPLGFAGMFVRRGEVRAAHAAGIPFCRSTVGIAGINELRASGLPFWFQLYIVRDREFVAGLMTRAAAAGCTTLIVTLDLPTPGIRYRDIRSRMTGRLDAAGQFRAAADVAIRPHWLWDVSVRGRPHSFGNLLGVAPEHGGFAAAWDWIGSNFDQSVTWDDVARIREKWRGNLVVKGILHPKDALRAVACGCDGIVVSNHGGRQLDGATASITALHAIVAAVGGRAAVLIDGGFRSGLDVLKALKLGAQGVLLGRAWAMALAAGGERGVARMLTSIAAELRTGAVLSGGLRGGAAGQASSIERRNAKMIDSSEGPSDYGQTRPAQPGGYPTPFQKCMFPFYP